MRRRPGHARATRRLAAWLALLALLLGGAGAPAQPMPVPASAAAGAAVCPASGTDLTTEALFGRWQARFDDLPGVASVQLARHPDYDGVRGTITRAGPAGTAAPAPVAQLAGDIGDDGMLNLDESQDGHAISGVWLGQLQAESCGKEWKGVWRDAANDSLHNFVLTRTGDAASPP